MKKNIIIIFILIIIAISSFYVWYSGVSSGQREVLNYNSEYETYTEGVISGIDLTTVMNKAIDNNEKYSIEKNENGAYINDNEYYTEIYIKLSLEGSNYLMEAFQQIGMEEFTSLYGSLYFQCVEIEYHENGRISNIYFEILGD